MFQLIEHILEFTCVAERITSYWVLSNGKKVYVPDMREHADVVKAQPETFGIKPRELSDDPDENVQLAITRGALRVTYNAENGELSIVSKYFTNSVLDLSVEFAPGEVDTVLWDTRSKSVNGTVDEIYNML
jgi:hypothetical protein